MQYGEAVATPPLCELLSYIHTYTHVCACTHTPCTCTNTPTANADKGEESQNLEPTTRNSVPSLHALDSDGHESGGTEEGAGEGEQEPRTLDGAEIHGKANCKKDPALPQQSCSPLPTSLCRSPSNKHLARTLPKLLVAFSSAAPSVTAYHLPPGASCPHPETTPHVSSGPTSRPGERGKHCRDLADEAFHGDGRVRQAALGRSRA